MGLSEAIAHHNRAGEHLRMVKRMAENHNAANIARGVPTQEAVNNMIALMGPLTDAVLELSNCLADLLEREKARI